MFHWRQEQVAESRCCCQVASELRPVDHEAVCQGPKKLSGEAEGGDPGEGLYVDDLWTLERAHL